MELGDKKLPAVDTKIEKGLNYFLEKYKLSTFEIPDGRWHQNPKEMEEQSGVKGVYIVDRGHQTEGEYKGYSRTDFYYLNEFGVVTYRFSVAPTNPAEKLPIFDRDLPPLRVVGLFGRIQTSPDPQGNEPKTSLIIYSIEPKKPSTTSLPSTG